MVAQAISEHSMQYANQPACHWKYMYILHLLFDIYIFHTYIENKN